MDFLEVSLSSVILDKNKGCYRFPPREKIDQQNNYEDLFDFFTLFSDIFQTEEGIELLGPPLLNLKSSLEDGGIYIDGVDKTGKIIINELDRASKSIIPTIKDARQIEITFQDQKFIRDIQPDNTQFFLDRNVLVTHQRDNPLEWILYWILFHVEHHNIDSVLIYDNGSSNYSIDEVKDILANVKKIEKVCIVDWRIPFGLTGGHNQIWDSDYGQHQFLEHALKRLLRYANCAIIGDVDELPLHDHNIPLPDLLKNANQPVISYSRRNIVNVGSNTDSRVHSNTWMYEADKPLINKKYSISPRNLNLNTQLLVHQVVGSDVYFCKNLVSRHFMSLRVDWRNGNYSPKPFQDSSCYENLIKDSSLLHSFESVDSAFSEFISKYPISNIQHMALK